MQKKNYYKMNLKCLKEDKLEGLGKQQKGITLIALIITIIVMLILVAVAVNTAVNSGLFGHAKNATKQWADREKEERELGSNVDDIVSQYVPESLEKALENFTKNPENYKHPDQSSTNGDRAIGTDGKAVNMDLWQYEVESVEDPDGNMWNIAALVGEYGSAPEASAYANENIVDGKIKGTVPQYIKVDGDENVYTVMYMQGTFYECTNLIVAPEIPSTVVYMVDTFWGCENLTTVPKIPEGVYSIRRVFYYCKNLTNAPEIPSTVTNMDGTFSGCENLISVPKIPKNVENMFGTFSSCTKITIAPEIPASVTNMGNTFYGCTSLITAPEIPVNVTSMRYTFYGCTSLTGVIKINSIKIGDTSECFKNITNNLTIKVPADSTTYEKFNAYYESSSNITIEAF